MAGIGEEGEARVPGQEVRMFSRMQSLPNFARPPERGRPGLRCTVRNVRLSSLQRSSWRWSIPRLDLHNPQPD